MLKNQNIEIHEFSTGIQLGKTPNGGWISLGFTGRYMNSTIYPLPYVVERSIANREFALTEGAASEEPAMIGRIVGSGEDAWAVMAVVTKGRDEKGRSLSVCRYFLSAGEHSLRSIMAWWLISGKPIFNPFDVRTIGDSTRFNTEGLQYYDYDEEAKTLVLEVPEPFLLSPQQYDLPTVHFLSLKKHNHDKSEPVSWAFNVEALEKPRSFQVIQPASNKAYEFLQKEINRTVRVLTPKFVDEAALKAAIRALINNALKPGSIETITGSLVNHHMTTTHWEQLFVAEGITAAIHQKIYSPQMVRLMTLRAMVIPSTVPEFLSWLEADASKNPSEKEEISLRFQQQVAKDFPSEKLNEGIKLLIPRLLDGMITPKGIHWLFIKGRAWDVCRKPFIQDVAHDLALIEKECNSFKSSFLKGDYSKFKLPKESWEGLINGWKGIIGGCRYVEEYGGLACLFEILGEFSLAAYFYQVSQGSVPKNVFLAATPEPSNGAYDLQFLGLNLKRRITKVEMIMRFIKSNVELGILGIVLVGFCFGGFFVGYFMRDFFGKENGATRSTQSNQNVSKPTQSTPTPTPTPSVASSINNKELSNAVNNFNSRTLQALKDLNITGDRSAALRKALGLPNEWNESKFKDVLSSSPNTQNTNAHAKEELVKAIYNFQKKNNIKKADGIIDVRGKTYQKLQEEINKINKK